MNWFYEACRDEYTYPRCGKGAIKAEATDAEVRYCDIHMHHNIEIIYVIDAKMEVRLYKSENDFMSMILGPHQATIINCNIIHRTIPRADGEYLLTFIQPNILMPPVRPEVGKTFITPFQDDGKNTVMGLMDTLYRFSALYEAPSVESTLRTSLANAIMSLMLPEMGGEMIELNGSSLESALVNYVYKNYRNPELNIASASKLFGFTPRKAGEIFKRAVGVGLSRHLNQLRIGDAKSLLKSTEQSMESIAITVGFDNVRTFFRVFRDITGMTPGEFRRVSTRTTL